MDRIRPLWPKLLHFLWAFALVALPVTSFPLIARPLRVVVAPLSALPVLALAIAWLIPFVLRRGKLPKESAPLIAFFLAALAASAAALFLVIPTWRGRSVLSQEINAFFTLGIGAAFYLVFTTWPQDEDRLRKSLQWINLGGAVLLLWTLTQATFMLAKTPTPSWATFIKNFFTLEPSFFMSRGQRVTGLAYEASWFAHQMVMVYFPLWLAATYLRTSAYEFRILRLSVENILLALGAVEFYLSSPRIALISFLLLFLFLFTRANLALARRFARWITARAGTTWERVHPLLKTSLVLTTGVVLVAFYTAAATGLLYVGSQRDWRLQLLVSRPPSQSEIQGIISLNEDVLLYTSNRLAFLERMAYWLTGWNTFNDHPWLGVGLGNSGFFYLDQMPATGWSSFEIRNYIYRNQGHPNIKSFWVRLLAETGLLGFCIFVVWLYILGRSARLTEASPQPHLKLVALAGQCALVAFIGEGFSIDSFALPYLWLWLGLLSAAGLLHRRRLAAKVDAGDGSSRQVEQLQPEPAKR